ncbi:MAG: hypothetical protein JXD22_00355 [Sedimentisphaerales bacterium]|nr:hypothetical protein [Sedimentisphaerales bacterium]
MLRKTVMVCAFILTGLIIAGLVVIFAIRPPVGKCSSEDFWYLTCRVDIGSQYVECLAGGDYAEIQGEWVIFDFGHLHGSDLTKVRISDVLETLPQVLEKMANHRQEYLAVPPDDLNHGQDAHGTSSGNMLKRT